MTRTVIASTAKLALLVAIAPPSGSQAVAADLSPSQLAIDAAAQQGQYAFILFSRRNDAATQTMQQVLQTALASRQDAVIVPVQVGDAGEAAIIEQFDATRMPMPAIAILAPNGAVTGVYPQRVSAQHLVASIVSKGQAACLKALQDQKIVLLCVQPDVNGFVPDGVREFQADDLFRNRTKIVSVQANDPAEQRFLQQLEVPTDQPTPVTAFMAPPGILLGTYRSNVTHAVLAQRLAAAGKCCDDPNCKHHRNADGKTSTQR